MTTLSGWLERAATDPAGPVALHRAETLLPVEGRGAPFFPPTFASDPPYSIDTLADGTRVCLVDSVGSQANRMEPVFLEDPARELVPDVRIRYGDEARGTAGVLSLLEAGHRLGDAVVRCTELADDARAAFEALARGDATPMAKLGPTSLVFGAWDSRDTGVKVPRLVQGVIRAWSVSVLSRSAQYVPSLDYEALGLIGDEEKLKKAEKDSLSERGFLHAPAAGQPGGIVADGPIRRDVTLNLVQLRRLGGEPTPELRRYLLGLALVAAVYPQDPFLRQGCLLVPDIDAPARWVMVERDGTRVDVELDAGAALDWAREAARAFGVGAAREVTFDRARATADIERKKK